ncbi:MAG: glycosyltransferase family 87 protein [Bacteroidetes bacterium]|nr:glycosyltransferase family 87 protein [Bacteroidota bacterium]
MLKKNDILNGFTIFVTLACLLTFSLNMINGRFLLGDFKVYYSAAANFISGGKVYLESYYTGSGYYKYSPATLFFFLPYVCFSFKTAAIIHFFILGAAYWYTMVIIRKLVADYLLIRNVKREVLLLSVAFLCILIHFARELYLGNINVILLLLCCLSIRDFLTGKDNLGGILLGIVILTKPYLLILLLPLALRKKWRALAWFGVTVVCGLIIPFFFTGPVKGIGMYRDWINTVLMHGEGFPGMTSLDYIFRNVFPSWPNFGILVIFFSICTLVAVFILNNISNEKQGGRFAGIAGMNFMFEWFLLIALLPNLIKTDWVLMVFSAPLITFMIFFTASRKQYLWIPVLVILLFFYGANSDDLLGRELSHTIMQSGLMGLSNFLLVLVSCTMFIQLRNNAAGRNDPSA